MLREKIKLYRESKNMTQVESAELLGEKLAKMIKVCNFTSYDIIISTFKAIKWYTVFL